MTTLNKRTEFSAIGQRLNKMSSVRKQKPDCNQNRTEERDPATTIYMFQSISENVIPRVAPSQTANYAILNVV